MNREDKDWRSVKTDYQLIRSFTCSAFLSFFLSFSSLITTQVDQSIAFKLFFLYETIVGR